MRVFLRFYLVVREIDPPDYYGAEILSNFNAVPGVWFQAAVFSLSETNFGKLELVLRVFSIAVPPIF